MWIPVLSLGLLLRPFGDLVAWCLLFLPAPRWVWFPGSPFALSSGLVSPLLLASLSSGILFGPFLVRLLLDSTSSCMSVASDDENTELSVRVGPLRLVVSGPLSLAVAAVQAVTSWHHRLVSRPRDPSPDPSDSFSVVSSVQPPATSTARPSTSPGETRREIESAFPEVPSGLLLSARRLSGGGLSGEDRIRRAWKAGCWARAVLSGRAPTPNASEQLNLRPRIYIVLRSERLSASLRGTHSRIPSLRSRRLGCIVRRLTSPIRKYNRDGGAGRWNYRGGGGRGIHVFRAAGPCDGWRRTICYCMAYRSAPWHFETMFLVVLKRAGGLIGAIPLGVISDEEIQRGLSEASPHAMLGASTTIMVPGVHQDPSGGWELSGIEVALLVADFTSQVSDLLRLMVPEEPVFAFVSGQPAILPRPEELVSQVLEWLAAQGLARPEGPYQVDEEVEVTAQSGETAPPKAKGRSPRAGRDGPASPGKASTTKPKRVTTASCRSSKYFGEAAGGCFVCSQAIGSAFVCYRGPLETWSRRGCSQALEKSPTDDGDSAEATVDPCSSCCTSSSSRIGGRVCRGRVSLRCSRNICPVGGSHSAGVPSDISRFRPHGRPLYFRDKFIYKGCYGEGQAAGRASYSSEDLFRLRDEIHGKEDVTYHCLLRAVCRPVACNGDQWGQVSGALRGIWPSSRFRSPSVPDDDCLRLLDGQQPGGSKGYPGPDHRDAGAGGARQRALRSRFIAGFDGRPPGLNLHEPLLFGNFSCPGFCASCRSEMGDYSVGLSEGVGCDLYKEGRVRLWPPRFLELYNRQRRPGEQGKVPAKEERSRERPLPEHGRRGGELEEPSLVDSFGGSSGKTLQLPDLEMNFVGWNSLLLRFVQASHTALFWNLRGSFSVRWQGFSLHTTVHPLLLPTSGIHDGSGPELSKKRLRVLAQRCPLHPFVLVPNGLHWSQPASLAELRRPLSPWQLSIVGWSRGFITVSGPRSESYKVPPGRPGLKFIACLARFGCSLAEHLEFNGSYAHEWSSDYFGFLAFFVAQQSQLVSCKTIVVLTNPRVAWHFVDHWCTIGYGRITLLRSFSLPTSEQFFGTHVWVEDSNQQGDSGCNTYVGSLLFNIQRDPVKEKGGRLALAVAGQSFGRAFDTTHRGGPPGAEFGVRAHGALTERDGPLLGPGRFIDMIPSSFGGLWGAQITDDYSFVLLHSFSCEVEGCWACLCLQRARVACERRRFLVSSEEDICPAVLLTVAEGGISSPACAAIVGLVPPAPSLSKRLESGTISLQSKKIPAFLSSRGAMWSCGRALTSTFQRQVYGLADWSLSCGVLCDEVEGIFHLSLSSSADEPVKLGAMLPKSFCDPAAPPLDKVYVTDASFGRGAAVFQRHVQPRVEALRRSCGKRGFFTHLDSLSCATSCPFCYVVNEEFGECPSEFLSLQFCTLRDSGGAGNMSGKTAGPCAVSLAFVVLGGMLLCGSGSPRPMMQPKYMLELVVFGFLLLHLWCSTFSPVASLAVGSSNCPKGWDRCLQKTCSGTMTFPGSLVLPQVRHAGWPFLCYEQALQSSLVWRRE